MTGARAFQASVTRDRSAVTLALLLSVVFLAFHLPYLPSSLEDLDSINFALGVRHFDVAQHQPHPPGYPFYILIAKGVRLVSGSELSAPELIALELFSIWTSPISTDLIPLGTIT